MGGCENCKTLVVTKPDRLAKSNTDLLVYFVEHLSARSPHHRPEVEKAIRRHLGSGDGVLKVAKIVRVGYLTLLSLSARSLACSNCLFTSPIGWIVLKGYSWLGWTGLWHIRCTAVARVRWTYGGNWRW